MCLTCFLVERYPTLVLSLMVFIHTLLRPLSLQLLVPIIPQLERIAREPGGQQKINQYTYYLSIPMAILQSIGQINIFNSATLWRMVV